MAKVFNVDALAKESREIVLKGVTHQVREMSVDDFLAAMKTADELENKDAGPETQINALVSTVHRAIPTLTVEECRVMPFEHLNAISQFIRGEIPDGLKEVPVEEGKEADSKN